MASIAHQRARVDFGKLQGEQPFDGYQQYALSKFGNIVFIYTLAERLKGTGVTANYLHPGVINTKLLRAGGGGDGENLHEGAKGLVYLATAPELAHVSGTYFEKRRAGQSSR